jgi:Asp-tRNA(Asn)/Glu-tRNA(Gln) amidotransferase A subunit family amidase
MSSLNALSALEAAHRLSERRITAEALLRACLERIAERESVVGAWAFLDPELALAQARALDRGAIRGMLHGLPVGVKDIFDTCDMPTEYGSRIYAGHRPAADAGIVGLTRMAGGVVLGKTVTTEFATFPPGKTCNPLNPKHTPGGSSSGSAAGVADFMMPLAFGTQTAGSVIRPAAYCGVVGYKPTYNMLARGGIKLGSDTLDTIGVFARSVADAAFFAAALARRPELMLEESPGAAPRVGPCRTLAWPKIEPETGTAMEHAHSLLARAGAPVTEVALPELYSGMAAAQKTIMSYEGAANRSDELRRHPDKLHPRLAESLRQGMAVSGDAYERAQRLAREGRSRLAEVFADCDVLLAPAAPGEAPQGLASTGDPIMNAVWTLLYTPCISVTAMQGPRGLPVGLQVVGRAGDDRRTLAAADWIQRRLGR